MIFIEKFTSKKGKKWLVLYSLMTLIPLTIGLFIWTINVYWGDINLIVSDYLGSNLDLIALVYLLLLLPLFYSTWLFYISIRNLYKENRYHPHFINVILPIGILILYSAVGLFAFQQLEGYAHLAFQILVFYSNFIFTATILVLALVLYPLLSFFHKQLLQFREKSVKRKIKILTILGFLIIGYGIALIYPFLIRPPTVINYNLPPKPDIIAHRGGSQLGPENTLEVCETSIGFGIVGWEVDIQISKDGIPFLMHDSTLTRTTNVEEIYPEKKNEDADSFTWGELQQLNAGSWYVERDPWDLIASGLITEGQLEKYNEAKIPSFEQVLEFTKDNNLILDFDTKSPPSNHPYSSQYIDILFDLTIKSGVNLSKIMIPTSSSKWLNLINSRGASAIWTYGEYDNTGDGYTDEQYRNAYVSGFPIMTYTINSVERFQQLWCMGVKWVKTDTPHKYANIQRPLWYMNTFSYISYWILLELGAITAIVIVKYFKN